MNDKINGSVTESSGTKRVFVLGAGFTRAFLPEAPLMVDDYDGSHLLAKFHGFKYANQVLDWEISKQGTNINIERLMTRLYDRMPYDFPQGADQELGMLLVELKRNFVQRIQKARMRNVKDAELISFANYCLKNRIHCVTLNYDDVLDEALFKAAENSDKFAQPQVLWHPDGGYGYFCRPSDVCVEDTMVQMDLDVSMELLKLHGSINWFPKIGYSPPYSEDALVHHESWSQPSGMRKNEIISSHINQEPFIVPPILTKSAISEQPVLRLIWHRAYEVLRNASEVTFIGYSLPLTDISVTTLLFEALQGLTPDRIKIVNYGTDELEQQKLIDRYQNTLGHLSPSNFVFDGALEWVRSEISKT